MSCSRARTSSLHWRFRIAAPSTGWMLFRAASETLLTLSQDPKQLGAEIGCLALLHTWGQNLLAHPHLHCAISGGGISSDGERWVHGRDGFFLPVRVLSRMFRGKFLTLLLRTVAEIISHSWMDATCSSTSAGKRIF